MADRDQLLEQYAKVLQRRDETLAVLLDDHSTPAERRDAAVTHALLGEIGDDLEQRAGRVRVGVEQIERMLQRIGPVLDAIVGPQVGAATGSPYRYLEEDLVVAPAARGFAPRVLDQDDWARFYDGVVLELRALLEDAR